MQMGKAVITFITIHSGHTQKEVAIEFGEIAIFLNIC